MPWTNGIVLSVLVYYTAKISGGHLNPAVTLTFSLLGHTSPMEMVFYWVAQVAGCITGALFIAMLVPGQIMGTRPSGPFASLSGCFEPMHGISTMTTFGWEAVCTFAFVVPIFSVVWYTQNKNGYGNTGPLIVGLSLTANALACGQFTGASLNPARSIASHVVFKCPYSRWYVYVLAEFLGSALALFGIVPWYGISRNAWYAGCLPTWAYHVTRKNQRTIVLETIKEFDPPPSNTGLADVARSGHGGDTAFSPRFRRNSNMTSSIVGDLGDRPMRTDFTPNTMDDDGTLSKMGLFRSTPVRQSQEFFKVEISSNPFS
jgi:MIP family channel proteins